jgi:N-acetylneuraminic acid mutarotase
LGSIRKDFWEYDPATNAWTQKADFRGGARYGATGFSIGSKGYLGTGRDENLFPFKDLWEYDPATNAWTQKADLGVEGRKWAVGFSIGSKGYIGTG